MSSVAEWWKNETFIPLDWSPPPVPPEPPRRRWPRRLAVVTVGALAAASGGLGWLAWHEHAAAQKAQAVAATESARLTALDARVRVLEGQVGSTRQLLSSTGNVAGELQACIDATNRASSDFFGFITGADQKAKSTCRTAEADYQQLQSGTGSVP
jgi:hypothetical protein